MRQEVMLYVHIPFCVQKCQYCDFLSAAATPEARQRYVEALCREINAWKDVATDRVSSLFIGGGTPSVLETDQMAAIMAALRSSFSFWPDAELTIEVNPGTVTKEKAEAWRQEGINRVSMGVQSMDEKLLKRLGRIHNRRQIDESWQLLRAAGFDNLSMDLMMGLPDQNIALWEATLKEALKMKPEHLSCYSLILEEGTSFYEQQDQLRLPDEAEERWMYLRTKELLSEAGLFQYEISNFSQPGRESRHNTGYWRRKPYIGLGLGASSLLKEEIRYHNTDQMNIYLEKSGDVKALREDVETLTVSDQMEEFMFLGLRCCKGIEKTAFEHKFGRNIEAVYGDVIQKHQQDGLLEECGEWLRLTARGLDLANQVFVDFLL